MGGGIPSLNNASSEYLVDTENNKIILPYTTKENIIGLSEGPSIDVNAITNGIDNISTKIDTLIDKTSESESNESYNDTMIFESFKRVDSEIMSCYSDSSTTAGSTSFQLPDKDIIGKYELIATYSCVHCNHTYAEAMPFEYLPITVRVYIDKKAYPDMCILYAAANTLIYKHGGFTANIHEIVNISNNARGKYVIIELTVPPTKYFVTSTSTMNISFINRYIRISLRKIA